MNRNHLSGAAGFDGALLLLPILTRTIGTTMAVPVLTLAQLIGNVSRVNIGYRKIVWKSVFIFTAGAVPTVVLGAWSFVAVPKDIATRIIEVAIIIFVILKYFKLIQFKHGKIALVCGGALVGLLSGLVGSAGPLGAARILGTWLGKNIIENMPKEKFIKFVGVLLCVTGLQMIVFP